MQNMAWRIWRRSGTYLVRARGTAYFDSHKLRFCKRGNSIPLPHPATISCRIDGEVRAAFTWFWLSVPPYGP